MSIVHLQPNCGRIEPLDTRIAPAGLVLAVYVAATGELTLTGDLGANQVSVFQTGPSTYRVEGINTDVDAVGTTFRDIGKLTRVTIDGGAENDDFFLTNLRTLTALSFSGGSGDDTFEGRNLTVKGNVELHGNAGADSPEFTGVSTIITGNVTADSDFGANDRIEVGLRAQKTVIGGSVLFTGGGGFDLFSVGGDGPVSIGKGIDFDAGEGGGDLDLSSDGLLSIGKLDGFRSIQFTGRADQDTLRVEGSNVMLAGGIHFDGGSGDDRLDFDNATGTVKIGKLFGGESISFDGGQQKDTFRIGAANVTLAGGIGISNTGADDMTVIEGAESVVKIGKSGSGQSIHYNGSGGTSEDRLETRVANLTLAGGLEFSGDDGSSSIRLNGEGGVVKIGKLTGGQSILYNGGNLDDVLFAEVSQLTLAGGVEMTAAVGSNEITFDNNGVVKIGKFATGQSVKFTGTGDAENDLRLGGFVKLAGSVEMTGGTSFDDIDFDGTMSVGKSAAGVSVRMIAGAGGSEIEFDDNITLAGSLEFDGGDDDAFLDMSGCDLLIVKGAVEMIGGTGQDTFDLRAGSLLLGSTVTFSGGGDDDTFSIEADGSIAGNVSVDLGPGAAGTQSAQWKSKTGLPSGLVLKGTLTVDATGAAAGDDNLAILNVSIAKLIDLELGDGISTVNIDNLVAGDEFKLNTRGGADVVNIERENFFGGSVIKKLATILTGAGDDQLAIGGPLPALVAPFPDSTRVNFIGGLTADGGAGANDDRNDFAMENDFGVPLAPGQPAGFEMMTIV